MPLRYDCYTNHDLFEGLSDWLGLIFGASASPRPFNTKKKVAVSLSFTAAVHGGQHNTK